MPNVQWPDDRINDLSRRVSNVETIVPDVAVMKAAMATLSRELDRNTNATEHVARQLEDTKLEPLTRSRRIWGGIIIAVCGALAGGAFAVLGAVIAHS
jgi:hypothetical protein